MVAARSLARPAGSNVLEDLEASREKEAVILRRVRAIVWLLLADVANNSVTFAGVSLPVSQDAGIESLQKLFDFLFENA